MKKSDFHYELPAELIAQAPLPERSASRMLLVPPGDAAFADLGVRDLPALLQPGDLLVFNDTRVIPARLFGNKATGGRVEILVERLLPGNQARAQLGVSKPPQPGSRIALDAGGEAEVLSRDDAGFWQLRFHFPARTMRSVTRPCSPSKSAQSPRPPPACISMTRCSRRCASAGCGSATSPCMSAPAPSSRCGWTTSASTACTASGSTWAPSWCSRCGARERRAGG